MRCLWALVLCALWITISAWIGQEIDGLVYTVEEVDLLRLEKHISVWKVDLEESRGGNRKLEVLLAQRLMRESSLLMRTLRAYAGDIVPGEQTGVVSVPERRRVTTPPKVEKESKTSNGDRRMDSRRTRPGFWAGPGIEIEKNHVKRVKRNIFGEALHQLFGVATDEELQQQLRVDEELRDKVASTLTRQVYFEKEIVSAIGNLSAEEDRVVERVDVLEEKYWLDKERELRMDAHRFTLMEDVDRLEDILEAVVTGVVNTRHAAFLSAQAALSRVASFEFVNVTATSSGVTVRYLTRLFQTVEVRDVFIGATYSQVRTPSRDYFLHLSHGVEMSLTEMEVQGTREECDECAVAVHTGGRRYLVVIPGNLSCVRGGSSQLFVNRLEEGTVFKLGREDVCSNAKVRISAGGRHMSQYIVNAAGANPLDSLVLRRKELSGQVAARHSASEAHAALNIHMRQNLGMAQQDIENLISETQESFKLYTVTSTGTLTWLGAISILALLLIALIVRKCCQHAKGRGDDTVFIPPDMPSVGVRRPVPPPPKFPPPAIRVVSFPIEFPPPRHPCSPTPAVVFCVLSFYSPFLPFPPPTLLLGFVMFPFVGSYPPP
jgi:hypothetical protein